jgi:hypothetical protein
MLQFNPNDPGDTPYKLRRAIKESGLTLQQICNRLKSDFGVELTSSALSHSISSGSIRLQRALQILANCGVKKFKLAIKYHKGMNPGDRLRVDNN